jgi:hypothetical protein
MCAWEGDSVHAKEGRRVSKQAGDEQFRQDEPRGSVLLLPLLAVGGGVVNDDVGASLRARERGVKHVDGEMRTVAWTCARRDSYNTDRDVMCCALTRLCGRVNLAGEDRETKSI